MFENKHVAEKMGPLKNRLYVTLLVLVVVLAGASIYFYRQLSELRANPNIAAQKEVRDVVAQVSKLMVLPTGEDPTLATVADPDKLKGQSFFVNAKKGDRVLIYTTARKAILYDPASNKIVEVAPLNIGNQQ